MRIVVALLCTGVLVVCGGGAGYAFEPPQEVLALETTGSGMPDSTGEPMDDCCLLHEESDGYFMDYPPDIWQSGPLYSENCSDMDCFESVARRIGRELDLQRILTLRVREAHLQQGIQTARQDKPGILQE